jgi:hypothetical protein
MNNHPLMSILLAMLLGTGPAHAANGEIVISAPANGATVQAGEQFKLSYTANPGDEGDHLHFNLDGKRMDVIRQLKGSIEVDGLAPGPHRLCLLVNTKGHVPTSVETCIGITAQ